MLHSIDPEILFLKQEDVIKAGLLDMKDYVGNDYGLAEANVFMSRKTLFHMSDFWVVSQVFSSGMPDDYGVLPLPKGPDADKNVGVASNARYFSFIKGDPDIEDAAAVLVAIANRNAITGKEWIDRQAVDNLRDDDSIEMLQIMLQNAEAGDGRGRAGDPGTSGRELQPVDERLMLPARAEEGTA